MKEILNVFKSELYKVTKRKSLITTIIFLCVLPAFMLGCTLFSHTFHVPAFDGFSLFGVADSTWFPIVAGVFIAGCLGADYTDEGVKQVVSSGIPRRKFIVGQWLAHVTLMTVICLAIGTVFCGIDTIFAGFGSYNLADIMLCIFSEVITIGVLVSFVQTVMHISKSTGTTIAAIAFVFVVSGVVFQIAGQFLPAVTTVQNVWVTTVISNATRMSLDLGTRMLNLVGVMAYQALFLITSIVIFSKEQI